DAVHAPGAVAPCGGRGQLRAGEPGRLDAVGDATRLAAAPARASGLCHDPHRVGRGLLARRAATGARPGVTARDGPASMKPRSALLAALVIALLAARPHPLAGQEAVTLTLATSEPARFQASAARYMDANPDVTVRVLRVASDDLALYQQALAAHTPDIDLYDIEITWPGLFARHLFDMHAALP